MLHYEDENEDFSVLMRMMAAVAFVPEVDVSQAFYDVEREVRNTYNQNGIDVILDYFEDTYIGIQRRGRPRDDAIFPIRIWNMYNRTQDDLPRTNNHIEGWHKDFSGNCDGTHPTVWKLIRGFQRAEVATRTDLHQVLDGHPVVPKKKYADCAARMKNVVDNYPAR